MENKYFIAIFASIVFGIGLGMVLISLTNHDTQSSLCAYSIPDHIAFNCGTNQTINGFGVTLFQYKNALNEGCKVVEVTMPDNYTYTSHYELATCNNNSSLMQYPLNSKIFYKK